MRAGTLAALRAQATSHVRSGGSDVVCVNTAACVCWSVWAACRLRVGCCNGWALLLVAGSDGRGARICTPTLRCMLCMCADQNWKLACMLHAGCAGPVSEPAIGTVACSCHGSLAQAAVPQTAWLYVSCCCMLSQKNEALKNAGVVKTH